MADSDGKLDAVRAVLSHLSTGGGPRLRLVKSYTAGESRGAYRLIDRKGQYFALKLSTNTGVYNASVTTARLRHLGYPAPGCLQLGSLSGDEGFALYEELPGKPAGSMNAQTTEQVLRLIELQADQAVLVAEPRMVLDTLLHGAEDYAQHATLQAYSPATRQLLSEVIAIGRANIETNFPVDDIVHFDLNPDNILVEGAEVAGVVDWEGTCSGDRAFDIATLLFYAHRNPGVEAMLWPALLDRAGTRRASVYLAHMMLRQVEWSARFHASATVQMYLRRSAQLLAELKRVG